MRSTKIRNAAILLGIGLGGFLDGIVLHPIAQWVHLALWAVTIAGVFVLWSAVRGPGRLPSTRSFAGFLLIGWGAFNIAEGVLNHHLLGLHHVRDLPAHVAFYDWAFLILSGGLVLLGFALRDAGERVPATPFERRRSERRLAY